MDNPYKSPIAALDLSKRPYTRFRLFLDVFAIVFAVVPLIADLVFYELDLAPADEQPMVVVVAAYGCVFVITAGWIVSLALNTVGAFRGRVVSFVGLVLDFASMSAVLVRDFLNG
jgi:hypothetical protein